MTCQEGWQTSNSISYDNKKITISPFRQTRGLACLDWSSSIVVENDWPESWIKRGTSVSAVLSPHHVL